MSSYRIAKLAVFIVVALFGAIKVSGGWNDVTKALGLQGDATSQTGTAVRDVDGDTIMVKLDSGEEVRVRLIGIDTPEDVRPGVGVECGSRRAAAEMSRLVTGRAVRLESDPTQDSIDRYGRTLAYVYIQGQKQPVQTVMLRKGLAEVYVYDDNPFDRYSQFKSLEDEAKAADRGSWKTCDGNFHSDS